MFRDLPDVQKLDDLRPYGIDAADVRRRCATAVEYTDDNGVSYWLRDDRLPLFLPQKEE
jgi:hypothetical protein